MIRYRFRKLPEEGPVPRAERSSVSLNLYFVPYFCEKFCDGSLLNWVIARLGFRFYLYINSLLVLAENSAVHPMCSRSTPANALISTAFTMLHQRPRNVLLCEKSPTKKSSMKFTCGYCICRHSQDGQYRTVMNYLYDSV